MPNDWYLANTCHLPLCVEERVIVATPGLHQRPDESSRLCVLGIGHCWVPGHFTARQWLHSVSIATVAIVLFPRSAAIASTNVREQFSGCRSLNWHTAILNFIQKIHDRLCGLVVRVLGYRSGGPGSILGTTRKKKLVVLERGPLSLLSTTEELLDRK
jgi:hypothetical protein